MVQVIHIVDEIGKTFLIQRFQHGPGCCVLMLGVAFQQIDEKRD